jgi:hypothetical protein
MILSVLRILAAVSTLAIGVFALVKPRSIYAFTGLKASGARGITEIRVIFGALFIALGAGTMLLNAYLFLGVVYLSLAVVRGISMYIVDKSTAESSNLISLISELVLGLILVL